MSYLFWKLIHIASVVFFLGNILTGLFWAAHAYRSRNFSLLASTFDGIIRSDRIFTVPGIAGILVGGFGAATEARLPILGTGWILWSIVLFSISGIIFGIWVAPLQRKLAEEARTLEDTEDSWEKYGRIFRKWELWGLVALIAPMMAFVIMVLKPSLTGL